MATSAAPDGGESEHERRGQRWPARRSRRATASRSHDTAAGHVSRPVRRDQGTVGTPSPVRDRRRTGSRPMPHSTSVGRSTQADRRDGQLGVTDAHPSRKVHRPPSTTGAVVHRAVHGRRRRARHAGVRRAGRWRVRGPGVGERASERGARSRLRDGEPDLVLVATAAGGDVDAPAAQAAGAELAERVSAVDGVTEVSSYWSLGSPPPLRSADGDAALVLVRIDDDEAPAEEIVADVRDVVEGDAIAGLDVGVGGSEAVFADVTETIEGDLGRAEGIAIPITLLLLVLVFGGLLAASLPLFVGVLAVLGTFLSLYVIGLPDRRLGLRHQPDHRARARPRHRLQPVHRLPLPGGAAQRAQRRAGGRADGRDGRPDHRHQRPHRRRVPVGAARLPAVLPAVLRLCRHRRRAAGDGGVDRRPAIAARRRRPPHRLAPRVPPSAHQARGGRLLVPHGDARDASADPRRPRRRRRPAAARCAVPAGAVRHA